MISSSATPSPQPQDKGGRGILQEIFSARMGICLVTGFSSGLPLYVLIVLLAAFLKDSGVDLKIIGLFSLVTFPYTWKFLWAPLTDRFQLWGLGRRRGWMLTTQIVLILAIGSVGLFNPQHSLSIIMALVCLTALASATQDIVIDAFRREILTDRELGLGSSLFVNAYRIAGLVPGSLSLIAADFFPWHYVFAGTALFMLPGLILTLVVSEPQVSLAPKTLRQAVVEPFADFITRKGWGGALLCLIFVFFYKIGDSMATALATPFYLDLGFSLSVIGIVAKNVGIWSMVAGGMLGGILMLKIGINKALWLFGLAQWVPILGFALLAHMGGQGQASVWLLALVIGAEALGTGLGTAAFVSYIARECTPAFTATQFALLSSFSAVPRTFCNAATGFIVQAVGWEQFFYICALLALPGMLLLFKIAPWGADDKN
ncbi:MAG: AmpG family muropeptide MFS transporter [Candidatus Anaerobiospirillum merdipullorum]|uniref:AmpG family muropeptide MFS transporter n=1 Tax=Candidatus Anaerobiospirillum merdipullorum TaxID=2838450 RepID=A0A9E2NSY1_9GAMM|nr:AmpG family muropeptide MFS transporter [Candidatus Anaerobiospirillum merdipullorum]